MVGRVAVTDGSGGTLATGGVNTFGVARGAGMVVAAVVIKPDAFRVFLLLDVIGSGPFVVSRG